MYDQQAKRAFAIEVVQTLRDAGHQALWAGGCVRDLLLGLVPDDYDVATDAPPERVLRLFRRTVAVGESFGVVRVLGPRAAGQVEVATFRSDLAYVDGRRPEGVVYSSPEQDAARRDFTINGMFFDPIAGEVIDYVGGRADLEDRILRAIGDPAARFAEDKLRLLRAVRFAARFDLTIEPATRAALGAMADQVRVVAAERIGQELRKMLVHTSRARGMQFALETGLVDAILPDLARLRDLGHDALGDDAWRRTLRVLDALPEAPSITLATAALLHAAGRPEGPGVRADAVCRELRYSNAERERVAWLVEKQDVLRDAGSMPRSRLKRLLASEGIDELLALHRAIALAEGREAGHVDYCEHYLRHRPEGPINPPPLLTGDDLRQHGLTPGPQFKRILDAVRDAQLEGRLHDKEAALRWVDEWIARGGTEPDR